MAPDRVGGRRALVYGGFAVLLAIQVCLGLWGVADSWSRGHNGWNGAAYHNGARNTLRWGELFPLQYDTANTPPKKEQLYTHAPLALHLHNVASLRLFGDSESSIRLVAAFWNVAALCMLFAVVRRLWSNIHGLLAAAIYIALPINAIYTNMANHSSGFIFWSLLTLYLYVRASNQERWPWPNFVLFLASFAMAATWDWPAYYIALAITTHWLTKGDSPLFAGVKSRRLNPSKKGTVPFLRVGVFCGWVLILFAGHFGVVEWLTGNVDELTGTFNARRALSWERFRTHLFVVPEIMFTLPILALAGGWVVAWAVRLGRAEARARDLVPMAFLVAGLIHYFTFGWSAMVHSYWAWPTLPFVSIAVATSLLAIGSQIEKQVNGALEGRTSVLVRTRLAKGAAFSVAIFLVPLAVRDAQIVPQGRHVGGSMWFFTPVRGTIDTYDSGRAELRFAEHVKSWTDRNTGVQLHPSLKSRRLEPRFDITLDRATYRWAPRPRPHLDNDQGVDGWVFVALVDEFAESERIKLASHHPYRQFGNYFMVDLRREGLDIEIWELAPQPATVPWQFFHGSGESPVVASRSPAQEALLHEDIGQRHVD